MNGGTCRDGDHNFTCSCPSPYYGQRCQGAHYLMFSNSCDGVEMKAARETTLMIKNNSSIVHARSFLHFREN